jgi:hypothetical protein
LITILPSINELKEDELGFLHLHPFLERHNKIKGYKKLFLKSKVPDLLLKNVSRYLNTAGSNLKGTEIHLSFIKQNKLTSKIQKIF